MKKAAPAVCGVSVHKIGKFHKPWRKLLIQSDAPSIFSETQKEKYLASRFNVLSYLYLSPIFFASIGLKVVLPDMNAQIVGFAAVLTIAAILTKIVGCGLGSRLFGYTSREALQIGVEMVSRGEAALIAASKGAALGLMGTQFMGPVVIVVIITTIITPVLLKPVFNLPEK